MFNKYINKFLRSEIQLLSLSFDSVITLPPIAPMTQPLAPFMDPIKFDGDFEPETLKIPSSPIEAEELNIKPLDADELADKLANLSSSSFYGSDNISGPLDQFNVTELVGLKFEILGKFYLAITNISLYLALVLAVIIAIFHFGDNDSKLVPNKWSIVLETFFASLKGMVKDQIGLAYEVYLPLIFSIFFFFLTGNLISNIPYSFAANASGVVSIGYSLTFFLGVTIISLFKHGNKFFRNFIPEGTPLALVPLLVSIEFTSYTARGFSLGVRMFSNLFSGHCLLAILSVFGNQLLNVSWQTASLTVIFALPLFLAIIGLEVAVSFIQSFVLTLLSCSYVREAVVLH